MSFRRLRFLGLYLVVASLLQLSLYSLLLLNSEKFSAAFYFDPRIGLFILETVLRGREPSPPAISAWPVAILLLGLGLAFVFGRSLIKTYVISEILLSVPNLIFFFAVIAANLAPSHGFSIGELLIPMLVMIIFSIVPLTMAIRMRKEPAVASATIST